MSLFLTAREALASAALAAVTGIVFDAELVLGLLVIAGGAVVLGFGVAQLDAAWRSRGWAVTQGRIVESRIEETQSEGPMYRAVVTYTYPVGFEELTGERPHFGHTTSHSWKWPARRTRDKYKPGDSVTVYYDPDEPKESVLEPGLSPSAFLAVFIGSVLIAGAYWSTFVK